MSASPSSILDQHLRRARTIVELLTESRAKLDDDRQRQISAIASIVETNAKLYKDDTLLARYEKTRKYRSAAAMKAVKTRRRNAESATLAPVSRKDMPSA